MISTTENGEGAMLKVIDEPNLKGIDHAGYGTIRKGDYSRFIIEATGMNPTPIYENYKQLLETVIMTDTRGSMTINNNSILIDIEGQRHLTIGFLLQITPVLQNFEKIKIDLGEIEMQTKFLIYPPNDQRVPQIRTSLSNKIITSEVDRVNRVEAELIRNGNLAAIWDGQGINMLVKQLISFFKFKALPPQKQAAITRVKNAAQQEQHRQAQSSSKQLLDKYPSQPTLDLQGRVIDIGNGSMSFMDLTPIVKEKMGNTSYNGFTINGTQNVDNFVDRLRPVMNRKKQRFHWVAKGLHSDKSSDIIPKHINMLDISEIFKNNVIEFPDEELFLLLDSIEKVTITNSLVNNFEDGWHGVGMGMIIPYRMQFIGFAYKNVSTTQITREHHEKAFETVIEFVKDPSKMNFIYHNQIDDIMDIVYSTWKMKKERGFMGIVSTDSRGNSIQTAEFVSDKNPKYKYPGS